MANGNDREVIEAGRRRKGSDPKGRAEAPIRRRPDSGQGGGVPRPPGGGFRMPSKGKATGGCGTFVIILLILGYYLITGGAGLDLGAPVDQTYNEQYQEQSQQPQQPQVGFTPPLAASSGQTWLVMLYQDADDQVLEKDIFIDLNEAEKVGSSENVHIVAQLDRYRAGYSGDGDWSSARRYFVTRDDDLDRVGSQLVQDLGEVDMGSGQTLVDFVTWAVANFPADRYILIMSDHGMGWPGGWSDPSPGGRPDGSNSPLASKLGQNMYLNELDQALGLARQGAGIEKFDLIGMDACLMSQLEVYAALSPHAHVAVASEEVEPSLGWAYAGFLSALGSNPGMSAQDVGKLIVQSYIQDDERIVDTEARADFLRSGSPMGGLFGASSVSADQLAAQLSKNVTLTAVDLDYLPSVMAYMNSFVYSLQGDDQRLIAEARTYTQSYTNIFGKQVPPSFIDIGHFAALMERNTKDGRVAQAAENVLSGLNQFVISEKHGSGKPGSTGVAIYFPNSTLYSSPYTGPQSYTEIANRFAEASLWDDFLAFHYTNRTFNEQDITSVVPSTGSTRAPGQGQVIVSPIVASASVAAPDQPVRLSVDITGENIGYIYLFVGYYDSVSSSIYVADTDYLESPNALELSGVYYPQWSQDFTLTFTWDPIVFAVSDGQDTVPTLFSPESYGLTYEEAEYSVEGLYTFAESGEQRNARLFFQNGELISVYGFTGSDQTGAPREITPQPGDRFTFFEKWLDLDSDGSVKETIYQQGNTLTVGSQPFTWEELYAAQGEYIVGFIIEDLDGNQYPVYTQITVQ